MFLIKEGSIFIFRGEPKADDICAETREFETQSLCRDRLPAKQQGPLPLPIGRLRQQGIGGPGLLAQRFSGNP
jgi:hypothetical protein